MQKDADQQIRSAPSIDGRCSTVTSCKFGTRVSGGAYQDAREVISEWNARPKHCGPPKIRGSMHPASPSALFFHIFSRAREKIGPPEARQKRPRRNEALQARLLILCARFFLSTPQTEFAVWVFLCKSATTSQSASLTAPLLGEPLSAAAGFNPSVACGDSSRYTREPLFMKRSGFRGKPLLAFS